ncbi:MAG: SDR family oxidoreductase [Sandaracinus sp.]|nr:SDR family oxidoreductase [Sandaracinus sp.]MCB9615893.1 SDR family oxidoreductase [Sandaracinus sp.]MCB9624384.1 SDR family oxidoreductase [Sandaracinus sp.]
MSVLVVAGGSRGIGRALVLEARRSGHDVALAARGDAGLAEVLRETESFPGRSIGVRADVSSATDVARLFEEAAKLGPVDGVVANAATSEGGLLAWTDDDATRRTFATNVEGVAHVLREGARAIGERRGQLVVIGSLAARGAPSNSVYAASKAALEPLVARVDRHLAPRIRCQLLVPGLVDTELVSTLPANVRERLLACAPLRRAATADEIGALALSLALGQARALAGRPIFATAGLQEIPG